MKVTRHGEIDWEDAVTVLGVGAFYLLNILYYTNIHVSDKSLMLHTGYGLSTHRKQKKELIAKGYLTLKQVAKAQYSYTIKDGSAHGQTN